MTDQNAPRTGGDDAICFTAGSQGSPFGAGVIHAWLASDRKTPVVVAGISMGAVSAAALQRCYQELAKDGSGDLEVKRWSWFRRYLSELSNNPLNVIWRAMPDPIDFFADKPPVRDTSGPCGLTGRDPC